MICTDTFVTGLAQVVTDMLFFTIGLILIEYLKVVRRMVCQSIEQGNRKRLKSIIVTHRKVIRFHGILNQVYLPIIITRHIVYGLNIFVTGFEIIVVSRDYPIPLPSISSPYYNEISF